MKVILFRPFVFTLEKVRNLNHFLGKNFEYFHLLPLIILFYFLSTVNVLKNIHELYCISFCYDKSTKLTLFFGEEKSNQFLFGFAHKTSYGLIQRILVLEEPAINIVTNSTSIMVQLKVGLHTWRPSVVWACQIVWTCPNGSRTAWPWESRWWPWGTVHCSWRMDRIPMGWN